MNPEYPVYIPSKGRWESRQTSKAMERMGIPYHIVVEEGEHEHYASVIDEKKILVLPHDYKGKLGEHQGLVSARNWIMEHSISIGAKRHWQIDDNVPYFSRLNNNWQTRVETGTIFKVMEDFADRYTNVAFAGPQYDFFAQSKEKHKPFRMNTRIYSCTLVNNELPYRWRGVYNDDTDISLRALKDGWCTVLFYAFIQEKAQTMTVRGGNTEIYHGEGRLQMAQSLVAQHPDVASVVWRFNRWHHHVDYSSFKKNRLIRKTGLVIPKGVNNYGMVLKEHKNG